MIIARNETIIVPNAEDGRFMAKQYEEDMRNANMQVRVKTNTQKITVCGNFIGDLPDDFIKHMRGIKA